MTSRQAWLTAPLLYVSSTTIPSHNHPPKRLKEYFARNYSSLKGISVLLIGTSLLAASLISHGQTPSPTLPAQNLSQPAAQRVSQDLQERERRLEALLAQNPSLPALQEMWEDTRRLENSVRVELTNAGVKDNVTIRHISEQYTKLLYKIFAPLVALYRTNIEQFSFDKDDGSSLTISLETFRSRVPQSWDPEVSELKTLWLARLDERGRLREATNKTSPEISNTQDKSNIQDISKIQDLAKPQDITQTKEIAKKDQAATKLDVSWVIKKHRTKIASLNLNQEFLKATLQVYFMGHYVPHRPFEEWIALVLENPAVENVTGIAMKDRRDRGVKIKMQGFPSMGLLFSLDGKQLYLTYVADHTERIYQVRTPAERMQLGIKMVEWSELNLKNRLSTEHSSANKK